MRCPKCGNQVPVKATECPRCALPTPMGSKSAVLHVHEPKPKASGRLGQMQAKASKNPLTKFVARLPLSKIKVPPALVVGVVILAAVGTVYGYLAMTNQICLNCAEVGGNYATELQVNDKKVRVEMRLYQFKSALTGQVLFKADNPPAVAPAQGTPPAGARPPYIQEIVEPIQSGTIESSNIKFQSFVRDGKSARVEFQGRLDEDNILKGQLKLTIPEFNCDGKTFPISIKKS